MHLKRFSSAVAAFVSAVLALGTFPLAAGAVPSSELQDQVDAAYATLTEYSNELETANNKLYALQQDLDATQKEIDQAEQDIAELEEKLADGQERLSERLAESYKQDSSSSPLSVLVGVSDFEELVTQLYYANRMIDYDSELVDEVKSTRAELQERRDELAEQEAEQQRLVDEQKQTNAEIESKVAEQQAYYESLDSELQAQLAEEEARRAAEEAARLAAEQEAQNNAQNNIDTGNNGGDTGGSTGGGADNGNTNSGSAPRARRRRPRPGGQELRLGRRGAERVRLLGPRDLLLRPTRLFHRALLPGPVRPRREPGAPRVRRRLPLAGRPRVLGVRRQRQRHLPRGHLHRRRPDARLLARRGRRGEHALRGRQLRGRRLAGVGRRALVPPEGDSMRRPRGPGGAVRRGRS